jgi:hypothetical protein
MLIISPIEHIHDAHLGAAYGLLLPLLIGHELIQTDALVHAHDLQLELRRLRAMEHHLYGFLL